MGSVDRALSLSDSLHDTQRPQCCFICFRKLALDIRQPRGKASRLLEELRDSHPRFWDSCLAFVTARRTKDDLPALRQQLHTNERQCPHRAGHLMQEHLLEDPVHVLVDALYQMLLACLAFGQHPMVNRRKAAKGFGTKHGRWPETPRKLFPSGEQPVVEMHTFWMSLRFSVSPLAVLGCTLLVARPHVLPHLVTPGQIPARLIYVVSQMLHRDLSQRPQGWEGNPPVDPAGDPKLPLADPDARAGLIDTGVSFLRAIIDGVESGMSDFAPFFFGYQHVIFHAMQAASRTLTPTDPNFICLIRYINLMVTVYKVSLPVDSRVSAAWPKETANTAPPSMAEVTLLNLTQLAKARTCTGPGCGKVVQDNGGKPFSICSRCKSVCYCGAECQQRAWKSAKYRHKDICPILCRLLAAASLSMPTAEFTAAFHRALEKEDQKTLFQWSATSSGLYSQATSQYLEQRITGLSGVPDTQLLAASEGLRPEDVRKMHEKISKDPDALRLMAEIISKRGSS